MSRRALTSDEDWVKFSEDDPWAFSMAQGRFSSVHEWAMAVGLFALPLFAASLLSFNAAPWSKWAVLVLGVVLVVSIGLIALTAKKLKFYDRIDSLRLNILSKRLREELAKEDDENDPLFQLAESRNSRLRGKSV